MTVKNFFLLIQNICANFGGFSLSFQGLLHPQIKFIQKEKIALTKLIKKSSEYN